MSGHIFLTKGRLKISNTQIAALTQLLLKNNLITEERDAFDESIQYKLTSEGVSFLESLSKQED